ncbi:MAG: hypothetical protein R6X02_01530 [Enhygromyxa sp.]
MALSLTSTADADPTSVVSATALPDLCAELDRYGDPARCQAIGPDMAPWWNDQVCCDERNCYEPSSRGCWKGTRAYWCENAVLFGDGSLACVYEVPSYCDVFPCTGPSDITARPLEHAICCHDVGCYDHEGGLCGGIEVWCGKGATNADGTVSCFDDED